MKGAPRIRYSPVSLKESNSATSSSAADDATGFAATNRGNLTGRRRSKSYRADIATGRRAARKFSIRRSRRRSPTAHPAPQSLSIVDGHQMAWATGVDTPCSAGEKCSGVGQDSLHSATINMVITRLKISQERSCSRSYPIRDGRGWSGEAGRCPMPQNERGDTSPDKQQVYGDRQRR